jgi:hypothetical protein
MTKTISKKPNTQASTPSAIMQGRHNRRSNRRPEEIGKSLGKFQMHVLAGRWDGRGDGVMEASKQLEDLNSKAYDTFLELNREIRHLQARWEDLWELKKSTRAKL